MAKNNYFVSQRWDEGIGNLMESEIGRNFDSQEELQTAASSGLLQSLMLPVADLALTYYDRRIKAYFRRAGIELGDEPLTVDAIQKRIAAATGLEIDDFSQAGLMAAVERPVARAVSELLGFAVTSVFNQEEFKSQVKQHVIQRLSDGEGGGILKGRTLHRLREAATWAASGRSIGDKRLILQRIYHRRYRAQHPQTWE